ncbi:hypothetical protein ACHAXS_007169 [Conticribra weissflogii]
MAMPFTGLDLTYILDRAQDQSTTTSDTSDWYHWDRNLMGFAPSPYNSVKMALVAEEVVKGDMYDV